MGNESCIVLDFFYSRYAVLKYNSPVTATWIYLLGTNENDNKQSNIRMYYQVPGDYNWQQGIHHLPFSLTTKKIHLNLLHVTCLQLNLQSCLHVWLGQARWLNAKAFSNF